MKFPTPADWVRKRFAEHYIEWRQRRIAAIRQHYGDSFFAGKSLLELGGNGPFVVLVHGNVSSSLFWQETLLALPEGVRGVAPDLRGFGASETKPVTNGQTAPLL